MRSGFDYDVVVAGGGPAGCLCAIGLARSGRRVVLADAPRPRAVDPAEGPSPRLPEVLAPEGVALLERLGLGRAMEGVASAPCRGVVSYWGEGEPEFLDLELVRLRAARRLDRPTFDGRMRRLAAEAGVDVRGPARVKLVGPPDAPALSFRLDIPGGRDGARPMTARFFADATGRGGSGGPWARRLHFDRLVALRLREPPALPRDGLLRVAPAASGWWYAVAPLGADDGAAVYLTDGDLLPRDPKALLDHLGREAEAAPQLGLGPIRSAPCRPLDARTGCRRVLQRGRTLPVGDSAFALDPLSGSGLTRGLVMAEHAAAAIDRSLAEDDPRPVETVALRGVRDFEDARRSGSAAYGRRPRRHDASEFWRRRR